MATKQKKKNNDFQFLNTLYVRGKYGDDGYNDYLGIVYRDNLTKEKHVMNIHNPEFTYYLINPDLLGPNKEAKYRIEETKEGLIYLKQRPVYVPIEDTIPIRCQYKEVYKDIASKTDRWELFNKFCRKEISFSYYKEELMKSGLTFSSDLNIEDFSIIEFLNTYKSSSNYLSKAYFDIECDTRGYRGFPDEHIAPCPINTIGFYNTENNTCYSFILRNSENPLIKKFEKNIDKYKIWVNDYFKKDFGEINYEFRFFDYEKQLILDFMTVVHDLKPDFNEGWNSKFDILTIMNRWINLGGKVEDIFCHEDFDEAYCEFVEDNKHQKANERNDVLHCSSYTMWIDGLINFATLRKSMQERRSYKLDDICEEEKVGRKEKYSDEANLQDLPYVNFKKFITYNIKDVLLLKKLEEKNKDIDQLYQLGLLTGTRFNKVMKKTVSLVNLRYQFYLKTGIVPSNNFNFNYTLKKGGADNKTDLDSFEGAVVCDPELNDYCGIEINGNLSKYIFNNVIDMDLASLYPNIIRAFNIDTTTQVGKVIILKTESNIVLDREKNNGNNFITSFMDSLNSRDYVYIANRFFNLPSADEIMDRYYKEVAV